MTILLSPLISSPLSSPLLSPLLSSLLSSPLLSSILSSPLQDTDGEPEETQQRECAIYSGLHMTGLQEGPDHLLRFLHP